MNGHIRSSCGQAAHSDEDATLCIAAKHRSRSRRNGKEMADVRVELAGLSQVQRVKLRAQQTVTESPPASNRLVQMTFRHYMILLLDDAELAPVGVKVSWGGGRWAAEVEKE